MRILATLALGALLTVAVAATASARRPALDRSPDLWATVNLCDTAKHPDEIGIRASMPGLGRRSVLWMRFQVQYLSRADGKWHNITEKADSGHVRVGVARRRVLESGWTFQFLPPAAGGAHTLRGAVTFRWRRGGRTVKKVREITEGGHRSTVGADPPRHSSALCRIS